MPPLQPLLWAHTALALAPERRYIQQYNTTFTCKPFQLCHPFRACIPFPTMVARCQHTLHHTIRGGESTYRTTTKNNTTITLSGCCFCMLLLSICTCGTYLRTWWLPRSPCIHTQIRGMNYPPTNPSAPFAIWKPKHKYTHAHTMSIIWKVS